MPVQGNIPKDPVILLSWINTKLRDEYASLDELCAALGTDKEGIISALSAIGFDYSSEANAFR